MIMTCINNDSSKALKNTHNEMIYAYVYVKAEDFIHHGYTVQELCVLCNESRWEI